MSLVTAVLSIAGMVVGVVLFVLFYRHKSCERGECGSCGLECPTPDLRDRKTKEGVKP